MSSAVGAAEDVSGQCKAPHSTGYLSGKRLSPMIVQFIFETVLQSDDVDEQSPLSNMATPLQVILRRRRARVRTRIHFLLCVKPYHFLILSYDQKRRR
jgi:hypothetical protein